VIGAPVQPGCRFEFKLASKRPVDQCNLNESQIMRR